MSAETIELRARILDEISAERDRQIAKHGDQSRLPDGTGPDVRPLAAIVDNAHAQASAPWLAERAKQVTDSRSQSKGNGKVTYRDILTEEVFEAFAEDDPAKLRAELIQVAGVAVQWIEALDQRPRQVC